jgi:phospholipid/cholesterol/gamma-HCH transport system substrate-binding protein
MKDRRSLIVLTVFLVVSALLSWTVIVTLERGVSGSVSRYAAMFTDVSGLRAGDDVRMAGVRVGRVDSIELDGNRARVGFEIQNDQTMYGDTVVAVTYQNLIGQRYLGLSRGKRGDPVALRPGATVPVENTQPSFDISKLLKGFEPLFGTLDRDAVDNITTALIKALQGDDGSITALVAQTTQLAESFAGPDQVLGQVISNLTTIVNGLADQSGNLTAVIEKTRAVFEGLEQSKQSLLDSVDKVSQVVDRAAQIAEADRPALEAFLEREPGFTQHFLDNKYKFGVMGYNLPFVLKGLARITQEGGYVDADICDVTFSLTPEMQPLLPEVVAALTPGGRIRHTARCR